MAHVAAFGLLVAISLAPLAFVAALVHQRELELAASRASRWLTGWRSRTPEPDSPPLELLAAKVRRLHADLSETSGRSMPKQRGTLAAYDAALVATAHALEVPTCLATLPPTGFDREVERLRLEDALRHAGLVWGPR